MTPPDSRHGRDPEDVDPFLGAILRTIQWVRENRTVVTAGAVVAILAVGAGLYYQNYRADVRRQAAGQLQELQTTMQAGVSPDTLARSVRSFIDRYGDTRYGDEARLIMARIHLANEGWQDAIATLRPLADEYAADVPTGYAARKLLAAAHEGAGDAASALELYTELAEDAQFAFQRHEAAANRGRLVAEQGRLEQAEGIFARLVAEADTAAGGVAPEDLRTYRVRLGEVRARMSGPSSGSGSASDSGPGTAQGEPADTTGAGGDA